MSESLKHKKTSAPGWVVEEYGGDGQAPLWAAHRSNYPVAYKDTEEEANEYTWSHHNKDLAKLEAENAELKRRLFELENFAMLLCDDVFSMMVDMDLLEVQNYSGVLDTVERGRDGDFDG